MADFDEMAMLFAVEIIHKHDNLNNVKQIRNIVRSYY